MDNVKRLELAMELVKLDRLAQIEAALKRPAPVDAGPASKYRAMHALEAPDNDLAIKAALLRIDAFLK